MRRLAPWTRKEGEKEEDLTLSDEAGRGGADKPRKDFGAIKKKGKVVLL